MLYISDIFDIVKFNDLGNHFYADDTQLYICFTPVTEQSIVSSKIERCLTDIKSFMNLNYFKLNIDKTNVIFLGNLRNLNKYPMDIGSQTFT